jgi:hypothetical protein
MKSRFDRRRSVEQPGNHDRVPLHSDARRLARAAEDLDTDLVIRMVRESVDDVGMIPTWERLVQPVWQYLGSRPGDLGEGSAAEHLYVQSAMSALSAGRRSPRPTAPSVLPACADEELP